jgi:hypothetical protein
MLKFSKFTVIALLLTFGFSAQAAEKAASSPRPTATRGDKSAKKQAADEAKLNVDPPQVLEERDFLLGLRFNRGDSFNGTALFGINAEYMLGPNIGINGQIQHGSYTSAFSVGPFSGQWNYKIWTVTALGAFHADLFKLPNFDPYVTVGLGHSFYSVEWSSDVNGLASPNVGAESGSFFVAAYLNFRYFINSAWGVSASIGTGMGLLGLGVDYVF